METQHSVHTVTEAATFACSLAHQHYLFIKYLDRKLQKTEKPACLTS
jgi:hypothetical protein